MAGITLGHHGGGLDRDRGDGRVTRVCEGEGSGGSEVYGVLRSVELRKDTNASTQAKWRFWLDPVEGGLNFNSAPELLNFIPVPGTFHNLLLFKRSIG